MAKYYITQVRWFTHPIYGLQTYVKILREDGDIEAEITMWDKHTPSEVLRILTEEFSTPQRPIKFVLGKQLERAERLGMFKKEGEEDG